MLSTCGIASFDSKLFVSLTKFKKCYDGGLLLRGNENSKVKIYESEFKDNDFCGIYIEGAANPPNIK